QPRSSDPMPTSWRWIRLRMKRFSHLSPHTGNPCFESLGQAQKGDARLRRASGSPQQTGVFLLVERLLRPISARTNNARDHAIAIEVVGGKDRTGKLVLDAACIGSLVGLVQGIVVVKHDGLYPSLRCKLADIVRVEMLGDEVGLERLGAFRRPMVPCGH